MKLTTRCGSAAIDGLNEALLAKAAEAKLLRTNRIRVDTTVVPANVAYPTDSGLLAKAVRRIAATAKRIRAAGGAMRTRVRDRSRAAGQRAHEIAAKLRTRSAAGRDEAQATVRRVTGELAELAALAAEEAERLLANAKRALRRAKTRPTNCANAVCTTQLRGGGAGGAGAVNELAELLEATRRIVAESRQRIAGITPDGATRRVSLHDADARPIAKGRLGRPVEFGHKAQIVDNDRRDRARSHRGAGQSARCAATGPGGGPGQEASPTRATHRHRRPRLRRSHVDKQLTDLGVTNVVIPRKGKPSPARRAEEHRKPFRRTVNWRTGSEGRISHL